MRVRILLAWHRIPVGSLSWAHMIRVALTSTQICVKTSQRGMQNKQQEQLAQIPPKPCVLLIRIIDFATRDPAGGKKMLELGKIRMGRYSRLSANCMIIQCA